MCGELNIDCQLHESNVLPVWKAHGQQLDVETSQLYMWLLDINEPDLVNRHEMVIEV